MKQIYTCSFFAISFLAAATSTAQAAAVDTSNRDAVLAFYNAQYSAGNPPPAIGFTGDVNSCNAGTTSPDFRAAVAKRVNFFRNMAGLPDATQDDMLSALAQPSALIQSANNELSHEPPKTWKCYTDVGAAASGKSNLAMSNTGWDAIDAYINEGGALGHRRWVLYSNLQRFGTGDVPQSGTSSATNALYVITGAGNTNTQPRDGFVAWPPKGFVPYRFAYGTWSFSLPNGDFSNATASMTDPMGAPVTLARASSLKNGYGDNTFSFDPSLPNVLPGGGGKLGPRPVGGGPDLAYTVTVNNVMVNNAPQNFTYTVTLVDVNDPVTDLKLFIPFISGQMPNGSTIGLLTTTDPNPDPNPTYKHTLVAGDGSDDNASFTIDNTCALKAAVDIDFTQKPVWKIRVRADNGHPNGTIEKAIVIAPFNN